MHINGITYKCDHEHTFYKPSTKIITSHNISFCVVNNSIVNSVSVGYRGIYYLNVHKFSDALNFN